MFGSILINSDEADKSLQKTDKHAEGVGNTLVKGIGIAAKWGAGLLASASTAGTGLFKVAESASKAGSAINDMSVRTGLSTDTLQELKFATNQVGVSFESITNSVGFLTKAMAGAEEGSEKVKQSFARLGITPTINGQMRQMNDIFMETVTKLSDMGNKTERNQLAIKLFGKGAMEIVPLLDQGSAGIAELGKKAHDLGLVLSVEAIKATDEFGDKLDALKASGEGAKNQIGVSLIPIFQELIDKILSNMPKIKEQIAKVGEFSSSVLSFAIENLPEVIGLIKGLTAVWLIQKGVLAGLAINKAFDWTVTKLIALETAAATKGTIAYTVVQKANSVATGIATGINFLFGSSLQLTGKQLLIVAAAIAVVVGLILLLTRGFSGARSEIEQTMGSMGNFTDVANTAQQTGYNQYSSKIPGLANGGRVTSAGRVLVGERAPEYLDLPLGATVTPLDNAGGTINIYATIPAKDLKEMQDVSDFFKRIKQVSRQGVR